MSSYPTQDKEFQKKCKKIQKKYYGFFSSENKLENAKKE